MNTFLGMNDAMIHVRWKVHFVGEEVRLDERQVFKLVSGLGWFLQLPHRILRSMGIRQLLRLGQEVEIVVFEDEVFVAEVVVRLQKPGCPVAVNQLPVAVDEDSIPTVVNWTAGDCYTRAIVDALRPAGYGLACQSRVSERYRAAMHLLVNSV